MNESALMEQAVPPPPGPITEQQRAALLAQALQQDVVAGGRVQSQSHGNAVVVRGRPVNHILHLILTVLTFGMWLFVWIILAVVGGERRTMVTVDDYGNVLKQRV